MVNPAMPSDPTPAPGRPRRRTPSAATPDAALPEAAAQHAALPDAGDASAEVRVRVLDDLSFTERQIGGRRTYVCHHLQKGDFYHFGAVEYEAARLFDGTRGMAEVSEQLNRQGIVWTPYDVARLASMLVRSGLAVVVGPSPAAAASGAGGPTADGGLETGGPQPAGQRVSRYLPLLLSQRITLLDADALAARGVGLFGRAFTPAGVAVWLMLVVSAALIMLWHRAEFVGELRRLFSPQSWPLMAALWCLIKVAHEAGHAIAARRQGVRVGRAGVLLFLFAPLAFVEVTDAWRLPRRWSRVQIALAGMYVELAIAALAAWLWWSDPSDLLRHLAVQVVVLGGPATLLVNANPLLRLDGYYVMADMLDIPNLRMHGRSQLSAQLQSWLLGRPAPPRLLTGWRGDVAVVHAACSILFQIVWMSGLVISVSLWAGGLGVLLGLVAVLTWFVLPVWRWVQGIRSSEDWQRSRPRVLALLTAGGAVLVVLMAMPSPLGRRVPVVVRYRDEQVARAASDGFVVAVLVDAGQRVVAGDVLVELDDPELKVQRDQLALDAEAARLRSRRLSRDGQVALASAELERHAGLLRSLVELDRQLASLRVRAQRDGVVCSRNPQRLTGRYVQQGDVLVSIGEEANKEVLASIESSDLEAYLQAGRQQRACLVRLRGGQRFRLIPAAPKPRVRQSIPHPALAAPVGGPLAVEPHSESADGSAYRLIAPRSESCSPLSAAVSQQLRAGQQGMLVIGDSRSLAQRTIDPLRRFLYSWFD